MLNYLFSTLNFADFVPARAFAAFFTALVIGLACGGKLITFLKCRQGKGQPIREDGPKSHLETKKGTPTMGGLLIIGASVLSALLWCRLSNPFVWTCLGVYLIYALIGFADDYVKVKNTAPTPFPAQCAFCSNFRPRLLPFWSSHILPRKTPALP